MSFDVSLLIMHIVLGRGKASSSRFASIDQGVINLQTLNLYGSTYSAGLCLSEDNNKQWEKHTLISEKYENKKRNNSNRKNL